MKAFFCGLLWLALVGLSFGPCKAKASEIPFGHAVELFGFSYAGTSWGVGILNRMAKWGGNEKCPNAILISSGVCFALCGIYRAGEWDDYRAAGMKHVLLRKFAWDCTGILLYDLTHLNIGLTSKRKGMEVDVSIPF